MRDTLLQKFKNFELKSDLNELKGGQEIYCVTLDTTTGTFYQCWNLDTGENWLRGGPYGDGSIAEGGEL